MDMDPLCKGHPLARKINRTRKARKRKQSRRAWRKKLYDARLAAAKNHLDIILPLKFPGWDQQMEAHAAGGKIPPSLNSMTGRQKSAMLTTSLAFQARPTHQS